MTFENWLGDLRHSLRTLLRAPGYSGLVIATLAVGIAAVTVVVGVFSPYFLRPLPFDDPERVVHLGLVDPDTGWDMARFSAAQLHDLRDQASSFDGLGGYYYGIVNLSGAGSDAAPEQVMTTYLTEDLMGLLGVDAAEGRTLTAGDALGDVVVVGWSLWQRRWGGDADLVGQTVWLDDAAHTVVGIMPAHFSFPFNEVQMWRPLELPAAAERKGTGHLVVGRLTDGETMASARAELGTIHARLAAQYPEVDGEYSGIVVKDMREALNFAWDPLRISFALLLAAVAALLLLACVNVANLVLARGLARRQELAVRQALGGGRGDLVRPFLLESGVLAVCGGLLGLLAARAGLTAIAPLVPDGLFRVGDPRLDGMVTWVGLGVALATPFLFGFLPAWRLSRGHLFDALRDGGRSGASRRDARGRSALVVVQVTLAVVLVAGAALMSRSLVSVLQQDVGFAADHVLVAQMSPPKARYADPESLAAFYDQAETKLAALPGVRAAGSTSFLPLNHETIPVWAAPTGSDLDPESWPSGYISNVSPTYFDAMDVPVLRGRTFEPADVGSDGILISREFAQRLWPGEDPLGRTVSWRSSGEPRAGRVLGVVGTVRFEDLTGAPASHLYLPISGTSRRGRFVVVGTHGDPAAMQSSVRGALAEIDPTLPITLRPMNEVIQESTIQWSVSSVFLGVFGALALGLATLGIYGIVSWSVRRRRREIGIRMALGAGRTRILRWVLADGLRLAAWGCGLGLGAVAALSPVLGNVLYGVGALDPISLGGVALLLAASALAAAFVPARQAAAQAPATVLRSD